MSRQPVLVDRLVKWTIVAVMLVVGTLVPHPVSAQACPGDCDGGGEVTVNEIIVLVNIDLGTADASACPQGIASGEVVDVTLILKAVNSAINNCSATPAVTPTNMPTQTPAPTAGPFVGVFTGTGVVTAGRDKGMTGEVTIVIGGDGLAGFAFQSSNGFVGSGSGNANLLTGAVTMTQLSQQLSSDVMVSVKLNANGTGSGTFTTSNNKSNDSGTITIRNRANIASNYVGAYLGTFNITAGPLPDGTSNWPIELFVDNDGSAGGDTFDPSGDGFSFQGTVDFTSGAFTLAVSPGAGITGTLTGDTLANGTFNLSSGNTGTVSFSKVAP